MADDARYSVELLDALRDLPDVTKGLAEKPRYGTMHLEIGAYEREGDAGGCGHGSSLLPLRLAPEILRFAEQLIRAELARLDIQLEAGITAHPSTER